MSEAKLFTNFNQVDSLKGVVLLDYQGTVELYCKMIAEWKEASQGQSLFGIEGNVGHILHDFGIILAMPSDLLYELLK